MAGITGLAVVGIPSHVVVFIIHIVFIMLMAIDAGKLLVIGSQMAFGTGDVPVGSRSNREAMVEDGLVPGDVGAEMAVFTGGGETGGLVVGVGGGLVIGSMAAVTIPGQVVALGDQQHHHPAPAAAWAAPTQSRLVWAPCSGQYWLWLKTAPNQVTASLLWQTTQSVGNPACRWLGFWVAL